MTWKKKGIGLNPSSQTHYIDHLAPICVIMEIPLLFLEESDYQLGNKYYPDLKAMQGKYEEFSPEFLIKNYDVSFMSDLWDRRTMRVKYAEFEKKYQKRWRNVHCPHGFSDKGFYLAKCAMEDITLLYGDNMIDQLKSFGVWEDIGSYVITGNYRYTYFKKHRAFYDELIRQEVLSKFEKQQPIIIYAPTWMDLENSTSFFDAYEATLGKLPDHYNLIVKLHPRLELDDVVNYYRIIGQYEGKGNIIFLKDFPMVFPLLAHADAYLGDMSSVGYDFLAFDKPLFLLNLQNRDSKSDRGLYLFRCGIEVTPDQLPNLYDLMAKHMSHDTMSDSRKEMWEYTFGKEKPFSQIRDEIIAACDVVQDEQAYTSR